MSHDPHAGNQQREERRPSSVVEQLQEEERLRHRNEPAEHEEELVDEQGKETFPASDSPSTY